MRFTASRLHNEERFRPRAVGARADDPRPGSRRTNMDDRLDHTDPVSDDRVPSSKVPPGKIGGAAERGLEKTDRKPASTEKPDDEYGGTGDEPKPPDDIPT